MALARWQATIVDEAGNVLPGAQVTVRREMVGAPLAVLYEDRDGLVPLGNPFPAGGDGFAAFHVEGGAFRIDAVSGSSMRTWRYVPVGTLAEQDSDSASLSGTVALASGTQLSWDGGDVSISHSANALAFTGATSGYSFDGDLLLPSGGVINFNAGDATITHSANALAFAGASLGYTFDADITQSALGGLWEDVSPFVNIARLERVFIGNGATCPGNFSGTQGGDVAPTDTDGANWALRDAQLLSVAEAGLIGVVGFSKSSQQIAAPTDCIGVGGFVINDKASGVAWALYADVQHESGANASYGIEVAAKNKGSNVTPDPYSISSGVFGAWLAGGGDDFYGGSAANPSAAAVAIINGTHTWNRGIVFEAASITGTDGVTGTGIAIEMAKGHSIRWKSAAGVVGANIRSDVVTSGQNTTLLFSDNLATFFSATDKTMLSLQQVASGINGVRIINSIAAAAPQVSAIGDDTNIDLFLVPKGTGRVKYGTFTGAADAVSTGYVEILDAGGTVRRLMVRA